MTRVLLSDDHGVIRQGLRAFLEQNGMKVIAEAENGVEAVDLAQKHRPDICVLDIGMPLLNGIDAAREIAQVSPSSRVILLTMYFEDQYVFSAMKQGVAGYVLKSQSATDLIQAIREVLRGNTYLSPKISEVVVRGMVTGSRPAEDNLTARERRTLQLIAEGKTSKEIAVELGISVRTAESHRANIMEKLGIHDTAGLVKYAIRIGLITP